MGVNVKDIIKENIVAKTAERASSSSHCPTIEDIFTTGRNTTRFVKVAANTATVTSEVPW